MPNTNILNIAAPVREALENRRPVVALESTVIAHGLPHPVNIEVARRLETIVRDAGALPATIAVLDGVLTVGLSDDELNLLATSTGVHKLSIRDLPIAVACRWNGATTVATTSWIAEKAGIKVFATGGIGGVHRGGTFDISADLPQLSSSRIVVVCSGAKMVLDLEATREWLETHGVTVVGYCTDVFPAFYSRESGLSVDVRADTPDAVAKIAQSRWRLDMNGAVVVGVPVPSEAEPPPGPLAEALERALADASVKGIHGREITPFLLSRMAELSGGATLAANIALLENNARVAAEVAVALSKLLLKSDPTS
jgi:pseudouridine-5'-phosphate glycosidase